MEFRVGDRVKVIEMDDLDDKHGIFIGATATVTEVFETAVMVRFDDSNLRGGFNYYIYNNQLARIYNAFKLYELFEIYTNPENGDRVFEADDYNRIIKLEGCNIVISGVDITEFYTSESILELEVREIYLEHLTREELPERGVVVID